MYSNEDYLLELLTEAGLISQEEIDSIRGQLQGRESVVERLISDNRLSEEQVAQVCAQSSSMDYVDLAHLPIAPDVFDLVSDEVAKRFRAVPVADDGTYLTVAVADPLDFEVLDSLPHMLSREIHTVCATPSAINHIIQQNYGGAVAEETADDSFTVVGADGDEDAAADDAPIIKMVSSILLDSFKMKASDIHIEPMETCLRIRYRIDGKLVEIDNHPKKLHPAIIARIKVMSGSMSIAEKRLPQDGRIQIRVAGKEVDLRVSSVPSNHGESIVMRILDKTSLMLGLPELGFLSDDQETIEKMIRLPDGIVLVTGPTGSGKTTTLYGCLNTINTPDRKIITVEDPVEYELAGINQVMVNTDIGMTFAAALRAMMRQAPNVIMLGEIRDAETAGIAIQAALTGHLVFSTLHTNDAPGAVARLADIGVKRFLVASSVRAILAQRLVRKLCPSCKAPALLTDREMRTLNLDAKQAAESDIMGPQGCDNCRQSGYKGRAGIFEIFKVDDEVRHLINEELTSPQLRRRARELGMRTLREDGIRKVLAGMTSASEVMRVTMADSD
ncbi:Flp pilus assembly complex ATPase component TadA [Verrucomicrobiaceae bacterium R5-34]|uniref:Flp pilus assembly complex ATPase component TadA n=1 Tax=Oceaniferula flava TaxID=2800421 RepID=A0AAE2SB67_9BACT|nr:ATPase, T2SS/T4P/T4SS family [Oceaniferula flavus]MBK1831374.1 Flp pilus assembly complex ATPase component TadA [Verrucomicrobiaceae bacterium R5-34]MBK1854956.1 Flp pilus assembly complex ATPase component TadA [Oceaniferula flavus]MBM1136262.1 Flp pilus assembly complex ATPase component TadA [Oceaniferula flavus]